MQLGTKDSSYDVVPTGTYPARLVEVGAETPGKFGPRHPWRFEVTGASGRTAEVLGWSDPVIGSKSKSWPFVNALHGNKLKPGEPIDTDAITGKRCMLEIAKMKRTDGTDYNEIVGAEPMATDAASANDLPF